MSFSLWWATIFGVVFGLVFGTLMTNEKKFVVECENGKKFDVPHQSLNSKAYEELRSICLEDSDNKMPAIKFSVEDKMSFFEKLPFFIGSGVIIFFLCLYRYHAFHPLRDPHAILRSKGQRGRLQSAIDVSKSYALIVPVGGIITGVVFLAAAFYLNSAKILELKDVLLLSGLGLFLLMVFVSMLFLRFQNRDRNISRKRYRVPRGQAGKVQNSKIRVQSLMIS